MHQELVGAHKISTFNCSNIVKELYNAPFKIIILLNIIVKQIKIIQNTKKGKRKKKKMQENIDGKT